MRLAEIAHQRGEVAPLLVAGQARHALGGLLLHHHGDAFIARPAQQQALYDVGGDVVGQVGHHARAGGGEGGKVCFQRVGVEDAGVFAALEHGGKHRLQSPVQFHGGDGAGAMRKQAGHQAGAGADFQHIVRRRDAGKVDEVGKQVFIQQKVLPQRVGGLKAVFFQQHPRAQAGGNVVHGSLLVAFEAQKSRRAAGSGCWVSTFLLPARGG